MVEPSQVIDTVRTRSAAYLARYSAGWAPPSRVIMFSRLNALDTRVSVVAFGSKSPANCSRVN